MDFAVSPEQDELRRHICDLLEHIPGALDRPITVRWPDGSEEAATIGDVVSMQVAHVAGHIEEINRIKPYHGLTNAA